MNNSFSDQLRTAIDSSGVSRYAIARHTGIDAATIHRFMLGKGGLSIKGLDAIAEFLELAIIKRPPKARRKTK